MGRLEGKVAVVTGGGNGIGRAAAVRFAEEGAAVVVADLLDGPGGQTVRTIEEAGGRATFVSADVTRAGDNAAVARTAVERYGGLHVVLTAAGVATGGYRSGDMEQARATLEDMYSVGPAEAFLRLTAEDWQSVLDVNLTGTLTALQACVAAMLEHGTARGASLVTVASIGAKRPDASGIAYGCSKAGVWFLTKRLARDLAGSGIRVNSIGPGFIDTNMTATMRFMPEATREALLAQIPMGRLGTPREVADTALFLASDEASYVTGELLHPDGGVYTD